MMRKSVFIAALVIAISLLIVSMAAAAVSTSFEEFSPGTSGSAITVSGVSFSAACTVGPGFFSWNEAGDQMVLFNSFAGQPPAVEANGPQLAPAEPGACAMRFDEPQSSISFDWAACINAVWVTAYLDDVEVFSDTVSGVGMGEGTWEGYFSYEGQFDEVHVNSECMALDHLDTGAQQVAGCDVNIPIPNGSVVGAFTADAPTYWSPGNQTDPLITIGEGNTAWVLGMDSTGQYYKIVWVCDYLWVPVGTMGPNYDDVWNGTPLPTSVVE